mgnify:CR=1 FL=1
MLSAPARPLLLRQGEYPPLIRPSAPFLQILALSDYTDSSYIISAASLSFLGLGAQPPTPEWGAMLNEARADMVIAPHVAVFPALAIFLTVLAFNLLGDGLRDALDPKIKG